MCFINLKAHDLVLLFLKKILFFVLGVAHSDPFLGQVGPIMVIFRGFTYFFQNH